ncbi:MAG: STAS/SEC14 domain-containing protein [Myxococcota bacterium]
MDVSPRLLVDSQVGFAYVRGTAVVVVDTPEWTLALADGLYDETVPLTRANPNTLVHVTGVTPTPVVRRRLADRQRQLDLEIRNDSERRVAVVSDNAAIRGAVTALGWITGSSMKGFSSTTISGAALWLGLDPEGASEVADAYRECFALIQNRLGGRG